MPEFDSPTEYSAQLTALEKAYTELVGKNAQRSQALNRAGGQLNPILPLTVLMDTIIEVLAPDPLVRLSIQFRCEQRMAEILQEAQSALTSQRLAVTPGDVADLRHRPNGGKPHR